MSSFSQAAPENNQIIQEAEFKLREQEIKNKAAEIELKRSEAENSSKRGPILIAIWSAVAAAAANGVVSWFNGQQVHKLEIEKAQSAIILEVVKTNNPDKAANNLAFLVDIGLISEEQAGARLRNYLKTRVPGQGPSLSQSTKETGDSNSEGSCSAPGDYVVVDVRWGDTDDGLNIRVGPNQTVIGVIPQTGIGVDVGTCTGGWCQVRYKCFNGWAFAQHLALRSTRLAHVKVGPDEQGLVVRKDPGVSGVQTGTLAPKATDLVKHICQPAPLPTDEEWCLISADKVSGWVPAKNLEKEIMQQASQAALSGGLPSKAAPVSAPRPAGSAPSQPE
jgi:SH3-like domain-containing protein